MSARLALALLTSALTFAPAMAAGQGPGGFGGGQRMPPRMLRPGEDAPKGTAVLRGSVVAMDTGAPIRRAQVRAWAADGQDERTVLTDEQGRFELTELTGGHYTLTASKGGFVSLQYGQRRPSEPGTPVDLAAGQTLDKLVIGLPRGSVITGRIVDEFGEPLTGAQVRVMRYAWAQGARRLLPAGQSDRTDDQGSFRVFGLPPGDYIVSATLIEDRGGPRQNAGEPASTTGYAATYYPGTTNPAGAQRVTVGLGQEVGGIGFGLSLMRLSKVSGRILGAAGLDVAGTVAAVPDDNILMAIGNQRGGTVRADGTFEVSGLAPGRYTLMAGPRGRRNGDEPSGRTPIVVSGVDLANITIALAPPAALRGTVAADVEGATLRMAQVRLGFATTQPSAGPFGSSRQGRVADDATFEVLGITEPGYLRVTAPSGWYVKSIVKDGQDVTDTLLTLEPGAQAAGVKVTLTQTAASLSGAVRDARGNAVLDATVVVFPDDESKWTYQSRFISAARPDTSGRYEIKGLPRYAAYRVAAVQGLESGQASDPDFLRGLRDSAERLSLNEGETKALDLRLR
jgi:protocatechuate 3,4-dioxygenase beta subunit